MRIASTGSLVPVLILATLTACATQQPWRSAPGAAPQGRETVADAADAPPRGSFGIGLLVGGVEAEDDSVPSQSTEWDGSTVGGRVDVTAAAGEHVEIGARVSLARGRLEPQRFPFGVGNADLDVEQVAFGPVLRVWLTDHDAKVRPYIEGFVGGHRTDLEASIGSGSFGATVEDSDSGLFGGFGVGLAFRASDRARIVLGFEASRSDLDDLETTATTMQAHVGARFTF